MIDRQVFFDKIRGSQIFNGSLSQLQVDTMNSIIDECEKQSVTDIRQVAYIFATAAHEAYNPRRPELRLTPMKEYGGEKYLKSKPYYPYYGRGLSQITWLVNYKRETLRTGIDLVNNPDAILSLPLAANSHVYCMANGIYTGRKLSDYINANGCNFRSARKIINGLDQADLISEYAKQFLAALV